GVDTNARYFFFQAEDGIRDRNVTGVQTCALPIFLPDPGVADEHHALLELVVLGALRRPGAAVAGEDPDASGRDRPENPVALLVRSEERRVGKECRARRALSA